VLSAQPAISLIEGAFIYKFTHFIEWELSNSKFNICIYEDPAVYKSLKERTSGKSIKGNSINVQEVSPSQINQCQMLFLGKQVEKKLKASSKKQILDNKVFVVSRKDLNNEMSMINLKIKESKLSFDANKTLMKEMQIGISSKILRLADKVY
jgi:hypothetical protein